MILIGRQSSHYTRVARMFAAELGLDYTFEPIFELMSHDAAVFAGNPALKLPILQVGDDTYFGTLNICRVLWRAAGSPRGIRWPEDASTPLEMNANELLAHAMSVEVEIVMHEVVEKRPPDNASKKRRLSLMNTLAWLDANLDAVRTSAEISLFDIGLYCVLEHFAFRNPIDLTEMPRLQAFIREFGGRESARATPYRFDSR